MKESDVQLIHVDIHLILPCHATTIALQCRTRHSSVRKFSDTGVSSVSSVGNFGPHFSVSVGSHLHYQQHWTELNVEVERFEPKPFPKLRVADMVSPNVPTRDTTHHSDAVMVERA